jgi:hypothetical protein
VKRGESEIQGFCFLFFFLLRKIISNVFKSMGGFHLNISNGRVRMEETHDKGIFTASFSFSLCLIGVPGICLKLMLVQQTSDMSSGT